MKIIFICGCLEPGFDGVGDYTRRLASGLGKQGIEVAALALNDQFVSEPTNQGQMADGLSIDTYRLPSIFSSKKRHGCAESWINQINPDWFSLQFVPFSFNTKGIAFYLGENLSKLTKIRKWHIMFHELWVGMDINSSLKHKIWGEVQKVLIKSLIEKLNPSLITTQTKLYQIQLNKLNYKAELLPLFSNIPFYENPTKHITENKKISFVNFGTIHPGAPFKDFANECSVYAKNNQVDFELILLGRCGSEQENWEQIWKEAGLSLSILGEQPAKKISQILCSSTFGVSSTAFPLIEKSGSVAAMFEHGLPVICISKPWQPRGINKLPTINGVIPYISGNLVACLNSKLKINPTSVEKVSKGLIVKLKGVANVHAKT